MYSTDDQSSVSSLSATCTQRTMSYLPNNPENDDEDVNNINTFEHEYYSPSEELNTELQPVMTGAPDSETPQLRVRVPTVHENVYYQETSSSKEYRPPPSHGYAYGHTAYPLTQNTAYQLSYQRYTLIVVSCLAVTSILQLSRSSFLPYAPMGQQNTWANQNFSNGMMGRGNGGYNGLNNNNYPSYYGNGRPMMQRNDPMKNNMGGYYGNGVSNGQNQQQQEGQEGQEGQDGQFEETASEASVEGEVTDLGMENYPLAELSNFKDNWDEWDPSDVPMFFHIPKAGGSTVKDIIGTCHRFVMATETGVMDGHADDKEIEVVYPGGIGPKGQDRSPFVNVDTTTVEGITRANDMGFADSGLADAVVTYFLYEANELFTPTAKGRAFTVFRHPIDRAISMFYYIQVADWEPTYDPSLKDMTIEEYAQSPKIENNWLTRQLSNKPEGDLADEDLDLAMEVIRRKFMVGLMSEIEATMERFERFFRWKYHVNPPNQEKCRETLLSGGSNSNSKNKKNKPKPGSEAWELLSWQNQFDLRLYEYIESLFKEQEQFVADIEVGYRNIDGTCCKCDPPTYPPEGFTCPLAILF